MNSLFECNWEYFLLFLPWALCAGTQGHCPGTQVTQTAALTSAQHLSADHPELWSHPQPIETSSSPNWIWPAGNTFTIKNDKVFSSVWFHAAVLNIYILLRLFFIWFHWPSATFHHCTSPCWRSPSVCLQTVWSCLWRCTERDESALLWWQRRTAGPQELESWRPEKSGAWGGQRRTPVIMVLLYGIQS